MSILYLHEPGRMAYDPALQRQRQLVEQVKTADTDDVHLLLLEHDPPVITLGRRGEQTDIRVPHDRLVAMGIEVHESSRGGLVTYHGPGQLVGYAIVHVGRRGRDVRGHVAALEETLIRTLGDYAIPARRSRGYTGVWVDGPDGREAKIAAIGVAVHRWVTYHGFALNVCPELSHFDLITPCGIADRGVTSMQRQLSEPVNIDDVTSALTRRFAEVFQCEQIERMTDTTC